MHGTNNGRINENCLKISGIKVIESHSLSKNAIPNNSVSVHALPSGGASEVLFWVKAKVFQEISFSRKVLILRRGLEPKYRAPTTQGHPSDLRYVKRSCTFNTRKEV